MPMVKCTGCGAKVSTVALSCPKCGTPVVVPPAKDGGKPGPTTVLVILLGVLLGLGIYLYAS